MLIGGLKVSFSIYVYKFSFPLPKEAPTEIWLSLAKRFWRRSLKMVDDDAATIGRTDGRMPEIGYTISSH